MQNFDLWLLICSKVQHMCKNTSSFRAVSFVVLMPNMTLSFFHQTMNFFQLIICLWLCLICGLTTCSSSGLDSGLNIPFPTEIYRQQEIILNCLQIGSKISCSMTMTFIVDLLLYFDFFRAYFACAAKYLTKSEISWLSLTTSLHPVLCAISWKLPCGTKFLRVLIFAILPAIRRNKFPQIKITTNIFPAKIYFRVNIL